MINWRKTAAVFPGQGSQVLGMGRDFAERFPLARETFQQADELLGYELSQICWRDEAALHQTEHTQPALYVCSLAIWRVLQAHIPEAQPGWMAGHSLGEFTALTAAGALDFAAGLRLVRRRGQLMRQAGEDFPGAMAALLGLDVAATKMLCEAVMRDSGRVVVLANDNCPGQAVVSGETVAVERLIEAARQAGARRAVKLAVSVAAHSPLMASVSHDFGQAIDDTPLSPPSCPVIGNVTADSLATPGDIRDELKRQLTGTVRWSESMSRIAADGAETFVEIGAGNVLSGLMRRIDRRAARHSLNTVAAFDAFIDALNA